MYGQSLTNDRLSLNIGRQLFLICSLLLALVASLYYLYDSGRKTDRKIDHYHLALVRSSLDIEKNIYEAQVWLSKYSRVQASSRRSPIGEHMTRTNYLKRLHAILKYSVEQIAHIQKTSDDSEFAYLSEDLLDQWRRLDRPLFLADKSFSSNQLRQLAISAEKLESIHNKQALALRARESGARLFNNLLFLVLLALAFFLGLVLYLKMRAIIVASMLSQSEITQRFEAIYDSISDAIVYADPDRKIKMVNPATVQQFGYEISELVGQKTEMLYADSEDYHRQGQIRFNPDSKKSPGDNDRDFTIPYELAYKKKDGQLFCGETLGIPVVGNDDKLWGYVGIIRDVTKRQRERRLLEESEAVLNRIFENSHTLMAYMDADFRFIRVNSAYAAIENKKPEDFPGKNHFDLYPNEENEEIFRRVVKSGEIHQSFAKAFEYKNAPELGTTHWDWSLMPVKDDGGQVTSLILVLVDVTERIKAEEQNLRSSNALSKHHEITADLLDKLPGMIYRCSNDKDWSLQFTNVGCHEVTGHDTSELLSGEVSYGDLVHPDDAEQVWGIVQQGIESRQPYELSYRILDKQGEVRQVWERGQGFYDDSGELEFLQGFILDVTAQHNTDEELRETQLRFKATFEQAAVGIAHVSLDGTFTRVNERLCQIVGYDEQALLSKTFQDITFPDDLDTDIAYVNSLLTGELDTYNMEKRYVCRNGDITWINLTVAIVRKSDGQPNYFISVIEDINRRKQVENALREHQDNLESLVDQRTLELKSTQEELVRKERLATLGQLTATVSHELRNPLAAMRPSLYVIQKSIEGGNQRLDDAIKRVDRNICRCDQIIDELLDFTRITDLSYEQIPIQAWIAEKIEDYSMPEGIQLEMKLDCQNAYVEMDPGRMQRVLVNLLDNACQAMIPEGRHTAKDSASELTVTVQAFDDRLSIRIQDTGTGIEESEFDNIFEPLFSTKGFGVGLGLPTVKQIVEQHNGSISIESEPGKGTCASVVLPLRKHDEVAA